jgi:hypothetical protein
MRTVIIWDVTLCSLVEVHLHFGGPYCQHLLGRRVCQATNQQESHCNQRQLTYLHTELSPS